MGYVEKADRVVHADHEVLQLKEVQSCSLKYIQLYMHAWCLQVLYLSALRELWDYRIPGSHACKAGCGTFYSGPFPVNSHSQYFCYLFVCLFFVLFCCCCCCCCMFKPFHNLINQPLLHTFNINFLTGTNRHTEFAMPSLFYSWL